MYENVNIVIYEKRAYFIIDFRPFPRDGTAAAPETRFFAFLFNFFFFIRLFFLTCY